MLFCAYLGMENNNKINKKETNMEKTMDINYHISQVYEIATSMGIKNPFDKYKFRELQVGSLYLDTLYLKVLLMVANDSTFGVDAA